MAFASPLASHALFWNVLLVLLSLDESHVFFRQPFSVAGSRIVRENPLFAASSFNLTADVLLTTTEFTSIHCLVFKDRGSYCRRLMPTTLIQFITVLFLSQVPFPSFIRRLVNVF